MMKFLSHVSPERLLTWRDGEVWSADNVLWAVDRMGIIEKLFAGAWVIVRQGSIKGPIKGIETVKINEKGGPDRRYVIDELFLSQVEAKLSMKSGSRKEHE